LDTGLHMLRKYSDRRTAFATTFLSIKRNVKVYVTSE